MRALVSIVMPSYNSEKFIEETIRSVQNQTYGHWELIIVDDCSKDDTVQMIEEIQMSDDRIKLLINSENLGPGKSRNRGITEAQGSFLTFLDSDDIWYPKFIEKSMSFEKLSEGFVFASYRRGDEVTLEPVFKDFIVPERVTYLDILKTNSISCLTAFVNLEKLGKKYMPEIRYRQDMGLWLQYLKKIKFAYGNQEILAIYRIRKNSHSRNKLNLLLPQWQFYRKTENLSILMSLYIMMVWAYRGFIKYK